MTSKSRYQVLRRNTVTGAGLAYIEATEKDARRHIYHCALDNVGLPRREATKLANEAALGEPFAFDDYLFTISVIA